MRRFWDISLFLILLVTGAAFLFAYTGRSSNTPSMPPQPPDEPILAAEPMDPALDRLPPASLPDLSKVDRSLIEPKGLVKPHYCLLVFGPQAKTRVWIIEDGDKLYVDRNANGDLTDDGEPVKLTERKEYTTIGADGKEAAYREWTYAPGAISPVDHPENPAELKLIRIQDGAEPAKYLIYVKGGGVPSQEAWWQPLLADNPAKAEVIHFGGPVLAKPLRGTAMLHLRDEHPELHFGLGTPGSGSHSFAFVECDGVPSTVRPVAQIAWPTAAGVLTERFSLIRRC
jgi:hypothetical protein